MLGAIILALAVIVGPTLAIMLVSRHLSRIDRQEQRSSEVD